MHDVHDVHDLDRSGAGCGPDLEPYTLNFFSKIQSDRRYVLIQENRKMSPEWLGVHGGRSYGPVSRGSSLPGPAVPYGYVRP